jgi:hypothetical protein
MGIGVVGKSVDSEPLVTIEYEKASGFGSLSADR